MSGARQPASLRPGREGWRGDVRTASLDVPPGNQAMSGSVSVIIPTYNGSRFLGEALESIFRQTLLPDEVVVVDDASTDGTPDGVAAMARRAPVPLRLLRLTENSGGPARPINVGVQAAQGEFIAVCDQDDLFCPAKLEEEVSRLRQDPRLVSVVALAGHLNRPDEPVLPEPVIQKLVRAGKAKDGYTELAGPTPLRLLMSEGMFAQGYPGFLFRRTDWRRKGAVDEGLRIASDYDLLCWLATQGVVAFLPRIHYLRRSHEGNLTKQWLEMWRDLTAVKKKYLTQNPWLLREQDLVQQVREEFFTFAYKAREQGHYGDAWRSHCFSLRALGPDRRTVAAVAKLLPYWLVRQRRANARKASAT